jgi:hypothetical protein
MMIRPKATLAEVYDRALEEEALLRELEETMTCHQCGVPVSEAWVYCPNCHGQLQHSCPSCGKLVRNEWEICVFCGGPQPRAAARPQLSTVQAAPSLQPVMPAAQPGSTSLRNPFRRETPPAPPSAAPFSDEVDAYRPAYAGIAGRETGETETVGCSIPSTLIPHPNLSINSLQPLPPLSHATIPPPSTAASYGRAAAAENNVGFTVCTPASRSPASGLRPERRHPTSRSSRCRQHNVGGRWLQACRRRSAQPAKVLIVCVWPMLGNSSANGVLVENRQINGVQ